jgi:lipopolysaccharide assembly outer membrane protein LptD (OstA)
MNLRFIAPFLAAVLLLAAAPKHPSSPPPPGGGAGFSFSDWHVTTGELNANWENGNFNTPGRIVLRRPGSDIQADHANGNFKTHQATLTGNVVLHDNNGVLTNFAGQTGRPQPATLTCDNLTIDGTSKTYVATGNVHFTQGASQVRANRAVMNGLTHDIHLYGNVQLTQ